MKSGGIFAAILFGGLILSGLFMYKSGLKVAPNERELLSGWPQECAQLLKEYDLDRLFDRLTDDFTDQQNNNKQTLKSFLLIERQHPLRWQAEIQSTQVEWDVQKPQEAKLEVNFILSKGPENSRSLESHFFNVELDMVKIDDQWKSSRARWKKIRSEQVSQVEKYSTDSSMRL